MGRNSAIQDGGILKEGTSWATPKPCMHAQDLAAVFNYHLAPLISTVCSIPRNCYLLSCGRVAVRSNWISTVEHMFKRMFTSPELRAMNIIKSLAYDYTNIHLMSDDLET